MFLWFESKSAVFILVSSLPPRRRAFLSFLATGATWEELVSRWWRVSFFNLTKLVPETRPMHFDRVQETTQPSLPRACLESHWSSDRAHDQYQHQIESAFIILAPSHQEYDGIWFITSLYWFARSRSPISLVRCAPGPLSTLCALLFTLSFIE